MMEKEIQEHYKRLLKGQPTNQNTAREAERQQMLQEKE
jgi:hypothetical protein